MRSSRVMEAAKVPTLKTKTTEAPVNRTKHTRREQHSPTFGRDQYRGPFVSVDDPKEYPGYSGGIR